MNKPRPVIGDKAQWGAEWPPRGEALMSAVRKAYGPRALLAFSTGKDALAAYLAMRPHFEEIVLVYFELVPGLSFVRDSLDYYERQFGQKIYRLPHPTFYEWLRTSAFQTPSRIGLIAGFELPADYTYSTAHDMLRAEEGLASDVPCANGIRAADSPMRRVSLMTHGPISYNSRQWSPVWEFNKADVLRILDVNNVRLPVDYRVFGRTFDGLDYRFMRPMKDHFPADYAKVLEWFPLVELGLWRIEKMGG